jgi:hypothetical protein
MITYSGRRGSHTWPTRPLSRVDPYLGTPPASALSVRHKVSKELGTLQVQHAQAVFISPVHTSAVHRPPNRGNFIDETAVGQLDSAIGSSTPVPQWPAVAGVGLFSARISLAPYLPVFASWYEATVIT